MTPEVLASPFQPFTGKYVSNSSGRVGGVVALVLGMGIGTLLMTSSQEDCSGGICGDSHPLIIPGLVVGLLGVLVGIPLMFYPDRAQVSTHALSD